MQSMKKLSIRAIKSRIITGEDDLFETIKGALDTSRPKNGDILAVTSKVVAVTQGRVMKIANEKEFKALVQQEAGDVIGGKDVILTLKNGIFTPWAGIDRSNTKKGTAVLWPEGSNKVARQIEIWLKKNYRLNKCGVIIVDSFCVPLRKGVSGITLGYSGFLGVEDKRGNKDLFDNSLQFTQEAVADNLAAIANLVMGQGNEQTPFAIISSAPVTFSDKKTEPRDLVMDARDCLYAPLYKGKIS